MRDKTRILVVDDQMAVALMIVCLLTQVGCEADAALDAKKALRLAQTEAFDLIILDVDMPNGFEMCSSLKENPFFQTPIAFVSARFGEDDVQRGLDLGAADFIERPFDSQDFLSRILSLVEEAATA
jgi:DNA-binding response OmpR family regulator